MNLNLFADIGVPDSQLHPKYKFLRDEPSLFGERAIVQDWTDNFIDRDNKIVKEFQTTFHSAFWEFFLYKLLVEAGHTIDFTKDRPDFIVKGVPDIYIEAVVSEIKKDGRSEETRNLDDILSMSIPPHQQQDFKNLINEAIVRNSNSILSKSRKYIDSYSKLEWVQETSPFVIAMSSYDQVNYGREFYYAMLALLFGRYYDPNTRNYYPVTSIQKPNTTSTIPVGLFHDEAYRHISAIIFPCTVTLGKLTSLSNSTTDPGQQFNKVVNILHDTDVPKFKLHIVGPEVPEELSDGIFIIHNPIAKHPLPQNFLASTNAVHIRSFPEGLQFNGENSPIVARLNMPKIMFPDLLLKSIFLSYNS